MTGATNAAKRRRRGRVLILYTGGTVGAVPAGPEPGSPLVPGPLATLRRSLARYLPNLGADSGIDWHLQLPCGGFEPVDSSNVGIEHWKQIARCIGEHYAEYDGFVVLHGTDTMAFTASVLSFLLGNLGKPVVLTGSQLPLIDERTDARTNLANALRVAGGHVAEPGRIPPIPEVVLCFGTVLLRGNRARKMSTTDLNGFESPNYPALGALGERIEIHRSLLLDRPRKPLAVDTRLEPGVIDFTFFPGVTAGLLEAVLIRSVVKGAVIRTFGAGNAMSHPDILGVFERAAERGVMLMNVTQCPHGRVDMGLYDTGAGLRRMGIIGGLDITPEAALAKMLWVLGSQRPGRARRAALLRNLRGEQSPA